MSKLLYAVYFAAGILVGWAASLNFSAEWVSAAGTWVGAIATIATIIWAVHSFQRQSQQRTDDLRRESSERHLAREAELTKQARLAEDFKIRCFGGGGHGHDGKKTMNSLHIELVNGTGHPVTLLGVSLPGVTFRRSVMDQLPPSVPPGESPKTLVEIEDFPAPDDQFSGRPLRAVVPEYSYRFAGVVWSRTGEAGPQRVD